MTQEEIRAHNPEVDRINAQRKADYEAALKRYEEDRIQYEDVNRIQQDGDLCLIGDPGKPGWDYYSDVSLLVTKNADNLGDVIWMQGIKWNDDTEIQGISILCRFRRQKAISEQSICQTRRISTCRTEPRIRMPEIPDITI